MEEDEEGKRATVTPAAAACLSAPHRLRLGVSLVWARGRAPEGTGNLSNVILAHSPQIV
jgi:hypothetical protein